MLGPSQKEIILAYVKLRGSITPAKLSDEDRALFGHNMFLGSETGKRCRELRADGKLSSVKVGKFEQFYLPDQPHQTGFEFGGVLMQGD